MNAMAVIKIQNRGLVLIVANCGRNCHIDFQPRQYLTMMMGRMSVVFQILSRFLPVAQRYRSSVHNRPKGQPGNDKKAPYLGLLMEAGPFPRVYQFSSPCARIHTFCHALDLARCNGKVVSGVTSTVAGCDVQ